MANAHRGDCVADSELKDVAVPGKTVPNLTAHKQMHRRLREEEEGGAGGMVVSVYCAAHRTGQKELHGNQRQSMARRKLFSWMTGYAAGRRQRVRFTCSAPGMCQFRSSMSQADM